MPGHEIESESPYAVEPWYWMDRKGTMPNMYYLYLSLGKSDLEMMYRYVFLRSKPYHGNIKSTPYRDPAKYPDKSELYHYTNLHTHTSRPGFITQYVSHTELMIFISPACCC